MSLYSAIRNARHFLLRANLALLMMGMIISQASARNIPNVIIKGNSPGVTIDLSKYFSFPLTVASTNTNANTVYVSTSQGDFVIKLFPTNAPNTVTRFIDYVTNGSYNNTFFDNTTPKVSIQAGAYSNNASLSPVTSLGTITNEADLSNTTGTLAMVLSTNTNGVLNPNSASTGWLINVTNNPTHDTTYSVTNQMTNTMTNQVITNGVTNSITNSVTNTITNTITNSAPYTVFGTVVGNGISNAVDKITSLRIANLASFFTAGPQFTSVPVQNAVNTVTLTNLVTISGMQMVSLPHIGPPTDSDTNAFSATLIGQKLLIAPRSSPQSPNTTPVTISISAADTNGNVETKSFQVSQLALTQLINSFSTIFANFSTSPFTFNNYSQFPTASSGLPVTLLIRSGPANVAAGGLYFTGTGTITMTASQAGKPPFYLPAPPVTGYIVVNKGSQTITFPTISNLTNQNLPVTMNLKSYPTSSVGLPVKVAVGFGPASMQGRTITITNAGTITLSATQGGNKFYSPAPTNNVIFTVTSNRPPSSTNN